MTFISCVHLDDLLVSSLLLVFSPSADFLQYQQILCNTLQILCNTCRFSATLCGFSAPPCGFSAIPADFLQHSADFLQYLQFFCNTPNANLVDHSGSAQDELHESEVSQSLMFCFDNASPDSTCFVVDLFCFISLWLRIAAFPEWDEKGRKYSTVHL